MGATVVDPASVITTHLSEVVKQNAGKLLSRASIKELVELVRRSDPTVVEELGSAQVTLAEVQRVLRDLLDEGVSVRNLSKIFEVVTEKVRTTRDPEALVEASRQALGPALSAALATDGHLPVVTIDPVLGREKPNGTGRCRSSSAQHPCGPRSKNSSGPRPRACPYCPTRSLVPNCASSPREW